MMTLRSTNNVTLVQFVDTDHIDARVSPRFKEEIKESLRTGPKNVIVDLDPITFIDSSGFGMLISLLKQVRSAGGRLILSGVHADVSDLMELLQLTQVFERVDTVEKALGIFEK